MSDTNKAQAPSADGSDGAGNASPESSGEPARGAASSDETTPKRRRRRRRGRNKAKTESGSAPASGSALDPGLAALAGGLLSHVDDRQVPCSVDGCDDTWTWSAADQIAAYGQPAPKRECSQCQSASATEVRCSVDGCKRTWTWSREAQIKHRAWRLRRNEGGSKKRRRRSDGPPRRKCDLCQAKLARLAERASVCKVHGCTRPVTLDKESQLRAWASTGRTDLDFEPPLAKQMCDVCREFCRSHNDREVACGRPGCDKSWTYKRGAQLQAFLAGRFEDPIRLCQDCERESRAQAQKAGVPANVEVMPCVVPGCDGVWHHRSGDKVPPCNDGEQPPERMCDAHRVALGLEPRMTARPSSPEGQNAPNAGAVEVVTSSPELDQENRPASSPNS